jgi:hypothetical protein
MKCLHRSFVKNGEGEVKLVPEEGEALSDALGVHYCLQNSFVCV